MHLGSTGRWPRWLLICPLLLGSVSLSLLLATQAQLPDANSRQQVQAFGRPSPLPLPSQLSVAEYEERLFDFLNKRQYEKLGWRADEEIRDTGAYRQGKYHGTHPAVRVVYSPGVIRWLKDGRAGKIPDGEMIIKEQYAAPALRHAGKTKEQLWEGLEAWTVMVKDSAGSHDGWFWSNPSKNQCVEDNHHYPFKHPVSGFGLYCVRCHSVTQTPGTEPAGAANEFTFASLRNVAGFSGQPLRFPVDDSWRKLLGETKPDPAAPVDLQRTPHARCAVPRPPEKRVRKSDMAFLNFFSSVKTLDVAEVACLPPTTHDWVVPKREGTQGFVTSNQCMSCHSGLMAPFGPSMFVPTSASAEYGAPGWDVSPYGEWRWTPMGLAGRDPIFYAQVESEIAILRKEFRDKPALLSKLSATLIDTCLRCHAAMGHREFSLDHPEGSSPFTFAHVEAIAGKKEHIGQGDSKYGALARDGVSCAVCHRMQPRAQPSRDPRPYLQFFLESSINGNVHLGKKGEIFGPYPDNEITPYAMEHGSGLKPKHSAYLQSSQLCGTCHTVVLPTVDRPVEPTKAGHGSEELLRSEGVPLFKSFQHHVEQATYLEWLNSEYENEIDKQNPRAKSCQDCHMSRGLKDRKHSLDIPQIKTKIAAIQDEKYPEAENLVAPEHLKIRTREKDYKRHNFGGLNVFLVEMFKQFDDVLGVPKDDFMTGSNQGLEHAVETFVQTARNDVAALDVKASWKEPGRVMARVVVKNKVGHRFPSGVGFRRAFVELVVTKQASSGKEEIVWASGRTNDLGVLLGADGKPLATEFFGRDPKTGQQTYQPHHKLITSPNQVQIYETLLRNAAGDLTTSFIHGCEIVKDNRLLPRGWKGNGPGPELTGYFLKATHSDPATAKNPSYTDGSGTDEVTYQIDLPAGVEPTNLQVRATLYYQAIPPYYLRNLFETAPDGPATRRLHYLCSHVDLKGTPIENWKLQITSATCELSRPR